MRPQRRAFLATDFMTEHSVVILAAGVGSRLKPLTDNLPKALVPVGDTPILARALEALAAPAREGRCDVSIVVGHRGEQIAAYTRSRYPFVRTIWNHHYTRTNNMFSLHLSLAHVPPSANLVFMNGDCLYDAAVLADAVSQSSTFVYCDPTRAYSDESMKIVVAAERVTAIAKTIEAGDAYAVSCDLYTIAAADTRALGDAIHEHIARGDLDSWTEVALNASMRGGTIHFRPRSVAGFWYEIDDHRDLAEAALLVRDGALAPVCH
jgi:choline kinase